MKRYHALFINKGFCDGFWDKEKDRYLNDYEIEELLNKADKYDSVWEKKYDELKEENKKLEKQNRYYRDLLLKNNII
jgi:hypothetical protein